MGTYEEIVMQAVSQLMVKAMSGQRESDELVEISQMVMAVSIDAETRAMLGRYLSLAATMFSTCCFLLKIPRRKSAISDLRRGILIYLHNNKRYA